MQCVTEIRMPVWRNKQNSKSLVVSGLASENKKHKTVFETILPLYPVTLYVLHLEVIGNV